MQKKKKQVLKNSSPKHAPQILGKLIFSHTNHIFVVLWKMFAEVIYLHFSNGVTS